MFQALSVIFNGYTVTSRTQAVTALILGCLTIIAIVLFSDYFVCASILVAIFAPLFFLIKGVVDTVTKSIDFLASV